MWQAYLQSSELREDGTLRLVIVFTDGSKKLSREFIINPNQSIKQLTIDTIAQLSQIDDKLKFPLGLIDLTPDIIPTPTQEEIDKQNYFILLNKWLRLKLDIDRGLLDISDTTFAKLDSDLKASYKIEYNNI